VTYHRATLHFLDEVHARVNVACDGRTEHSTLESYTVIICQQSRGAVSNKCIAVRKVATPLRELTCNMGSHSVTCHPAEVTFPPLPQPKLVID